MLKVTGDGRRAALDLRLVGEAPDPDGGKLATATQRIAAIHHATRDNTYADEGGQLTLRPGALQLVFCDVSTPAAAGWNAYDELRDLLVRRGVPRDQIRYMQSANTDAAKAKLFASCRDGGIAVLVGSTETMGVGTNVQTRAVAMHHLDAPWRPADIEQREGRILRQGNQNPEVQVIRYVTEGSFDTYMWLVNRTRGSTTCPPPAGTMVTTQRWRGRRPSRTNGPRTPGVRPLPCETWRRSGHGSAVRSWRPPMTRWSSRCRSPTTPALSGRRTPI